jgi:hypothetical protein
MISRSINYIIIRFYVGLLWKYTSVVKLRKNMACLEQTVRVYWLWSRATAGACNRFVPDPRDRFVMLGEGWHSRSASIQSLDVMVSSLSISMDGPTDGGHDNCGASAECWHADQYRRWIYWENLVTTKYLWVIFTNHVARMWNIPVLSSYSYFHSYSDVNSLYVGGQLFWNQHTI